MNSNRKQSIRDTVEQMDALIDQRSALQRQIRALKRSLKRELGIAPANFELALKLRSLAHKNSSMEDIAEVASVLGVRIPSVESESPEIVPPHIIAPVSQKDMVYQVLFTHGPAKAASLQEERLPNLRLQSVHAHLSKLKSEGKAENKLGVWRALG